MWHGLKIIELSIYLIILTVHTFYYSVKTNSVLLVLETLGLSLIIIIWVTFVLLNGNQEPIWKVKVKQYLPFNLLYFKGYLIIFYTSFSELSDVKSFYKMYQLWKSELCGVTSFRELECQIIKCSIFSLIYLFCDFKI